MKRAYLLLICLQLFAFEGFSQTKKKEYVDYISKYQKLALDCMRDYGVPASIKMAQGLIESSAGSSRLAVQANNHFGIKCKSDWKGQTISHDDDSKGECFRKYNTAYDSYIDHSEFLCNSSRYEFLFNYDITDYKSWAQGLKKAGYATNPAYADMLIKTIEDYNLQQLDSGNSQPQETVVEIVTMQPATAPAMQATTTIMGGNNAYKGPKANPGDFAVAKTAPTQIYKNNNVAFVIAEEGDTFASLAARSRKSKKALLAYNDLTSEPNTVAAGSIIYIAAKKPKAANGYLSHSVARGETLHYVSQLYGMSEDKLGALNNFDKGYIIKQGQRLRLR